MLNLKIVRENPRLVEKKIQAKIPDFSIKPFLTADEEMRRLTQQLELLQSEKNRLSKAIGEKKRLGEKSDALFKEGELLSQKIEALKKSHQALSVKWQALLEAMPNLPLDEVKVSQNVEDNECIAIYKERRAFAFAPKNHLELNEVLGLFDFPRGAKLGGTGWPTYSHLGAQLEWALINYMLDVHIANGFRMWMLPICARPEVMHGSGHLPKFEDQLFKVKDEDYHLYLLPTAEAALNGLHLDEVIPEEKLPLKYVSYTPCFRREAGAAGKNERGLIRTHQFNKVELFIFCTEEQAPKMFDAMLTSAEEVLRGLDMHYRTMRLVSSDMAFGAAKTLDLEVYLPGQERYYEVSSISTCTDFQARRANIKGKQQGKKAQFVHTLNGSGLATSRLMVALLENGQQEDGSVVIPKALHPYIKGPKVLLPKL